MNEEEKYYSQVKDEQLKNILNFQLITIDKSNNEERQYKQRTINIIENEINKRQHVLIPNNQDKS